MEYEPVIGLEVHAQLSTESKIFCSCSTKFGAAPNDNTCPVCLGLPGALPVLNEKAVELALRAAVALQCTTPEVSIFARKNYFYPDLPKGYQISQFDRPLAIDGHLMIRTGTGERKIRIKRIHMEEDAGKLLHEGIENEKDASFVDLNRAGVPLIEIVSEPDLANPEQAHSYLQRLKSILQFCEISAVNMEEGNLRCDANVSLRPAGTDELGVKVEIKNLNSFKNVQRALEFEIERQARLLMSGERLSQETRLFDANRGTTELMRSKEEAHDYRYFPEPDLLPLRISREMIELVERSLPELPEARQRRFEKEYDLSSEEAGILLEEKSLANFFEQVALLSHEPRAACNWILRDFLEKLKEENKRVPQSPIDPKHLAALIGLVRKGEINNNQAREVFAEMWQSGVSPESIIQEKSIRQISDSDELNHYVDEIFAANPDIVERLKNGETKLLGVLVGMVMKASKGKTNPPMVSELIRKRTSS